MINDVYLPFEKADLRKHFRSEKQLNKLLTSVENYEAFVKLHGQTPRAISKDVKNGRQMEKDENFWTVAALKTVYDAGKFPRLLAAAFDGKPPPFEGLDTWEAAVGDGGELLFEVGMSSPQLYRHSLRERFTKEGARAHPIPYVVSAGAGTTEFEGATKVDAVYVNPKNGFAAMFETKVLSDISCQVTFDASRNQLVRNIDVMLDDARMPGVARRFDATVLCLLTLPQFKDRRTSRYYGLLFDRYTDPKSGPDTLRQDLPHREKVDWVSVQKRLGWATFADCMTVCPGCCKWLHYPADVNGHGQRYQADSQPDIGSKSEGRNEI